MYRNSVKLENELEFYGKLMMPLSLTPSHLDYRFIYDDNHGI